MKMLAPGFVLFLFLCITVSVISAERGPRMPGENHHHENGEPGCWGKGPGGGPPGRGPGSGPESGRGPPFPPPPPPDDSDLEDDGNNDELGDDDNLENDEVEDGELDRIRVRQGQGQPPRSNQDMSQRKRS